MLPAPHVPAKSNDPLSTEEGESEADDGNMSNQGGEGVVDEMDDGLVHVNDLELTWGFDLEGVVRGVRPADAWTATGGAGYGATYTMGSSPGGAVDSPSAPVERVETAETMGSFQGGAVVASSAPVGRVETAETMVSYQGGAVDASPVPVGMYGGDQGEASASATGKGNDEHPPAVL